jgi:two-component system, chemotaxis family, CheB/CheR fusion protein
LTIARVLVELHGGTIEIESPGEGQGTTCIISLPQNHAVEVPR